MKRKFDYFELDLDYTESSIKRRKISKSLKRKRYRICSFFYREIKRRKIRPSFHDCRDQINEYKLRMHNNWSKSKMIFVNNEIKLQSTQYYFNVNRVLKVCCWERYCRKKNIMDTD